VVIGGVHHFNGSRPVAIGNGFRNHAVTAYHGGYGQVGGGFHGGGMHAGGGFHGGGGGHREARRVLSSAGKVKVSTLSVQSTHGQGWAPFLLHLLYLTLFTSPFSLR